MRRRRWLTLVAPVALIGVTASCNDEITALDRNFEENANWVATLSGANEVPAVTTSATGQVWFIDRGSVIDYYMEYSGLLAPANNSHIHRGAAGVAGAVMVQLALTRQQGGFVVGSIDMLNPDISSEAGTQTADELRNLMNTGGVYVNVHSVEPPGESTGEIRGQITPR
jgi:hypothetical protein